MIAIYVLLVAAGANVIFSLIMWLTLRSEQKRNRILQAFIAGLVRSISDYVSRTDRIDLDEMPETNTRFPVPYTKVLEAVEYELLKSEIATSPQNHERWLLSSRQLFGGKDRTGDGFEFINYDLFDSLIRRWQSGDLLTPREKGYLSEDVKVTPDNVGELQGEISMYKDL